MIKIIKSLIVGIVLGYAFILSSWAISISFYKVQIPETCSCVQIGQNVDYGIFIIVVIAITLFV